jgi:hypothetical protein
MRLPVAAALAALACSGGVSVDQGNAFPCDFSQGVAERDRACPTGWVCGVANLCQEKAEEGVPHGLPLPVVGDPQRVSPALIDFPITAIAGDSTGTRFFVGGDGGTFALNAASVMLQPDGTPLPLPALEQGAFANDVLGQGLQGVLLSGGQATALSFPDTVPSLLGGALATAPQAIGAFDSLGVHVQGPGSSTLLATVSDAGTLLQSLHFASGAPVLGGPFVLPDAGAVSDFQPLPYAGTLYELALAGMSDAGEIDVRFSGKAWDMLAPLPAVAPDSGTPRLRTSRDSRVIACAYASGVTSTGVAPPLLHAFGLATGAANSSGLALNELWSACVPCSGKVLGVNPLSIGGSSVEVLCRDATGNGTLVDVIGSNGATTCVRAPVAGVVDADEITSVDSSTNGQLSAGGQHGQIWVGESFQTLSPVFLDRSATVGPLRVPLPDGGAGPGFGWMADGTLFVPVSNNGFMNVALLDPKGQLPADFLPSGHVKKSVGWFVNASGAVLWMDASTLEGGRPVVRFGPSMIGPDGFAAAGPFSGFGVALPQVRSTILADGGALVSAGSGGGTLVLSADDSLYAWNVDVSALTSGGPNGDHLFPVLTPEPGFPIHSLDFIDSDGGSTIEGYVATLNSVYRVEYSGSPLRWSATQIVLPGRPVNVWTANDGTRHGRVGFQDGTVFTLPGAFPLTGPLPAGADGGSDPVLGFSDLLGWPLARTQSALFVGVPGDAGVEGLLSWQPLFSPAQKAMLDLGPHFTIGALQTNGSSRLEVVGGFGEVYEIPLTTGAPAP